MNLSWQSILFNVLSRVQERIVTFAVFRPSEIYIRGFDSSG